VSKTLDKGYFTLGKDFAKCNTRQKTLGKYFIGKGFFAEYFFRHSAKTLPSVEKHSAKKNTRQIKNKKTKMSGTIIRGTLKTSNSQLVTLISIKLQRPDGCD
jgi:hypothetical protein